MPRPGIEPGTSRSSVWRSPNWAIAAYDVSILYRMVCACHNRVSIPRPPDKPWDVGFSIRNIKKLHFLFFLLLLFFLFRLLHNRKKKIRSNFRSSRAVPNRWCYTRPRRPRRWRRRIILTVTTTDAQWARKVVIFWRINDNNNNNNKSDDANDG